SSGPEGGGWAGPELIGRREEPGGDTGHVAACDRQPGRVRRPECGADRWRGVDRSTKAVSAGSSHNLGTDSTTDCLAARERRMQFPWTRVALRGDQILERLRGGRKEIRQHGCRCPGHRASLGFELAPTIVPDGRVGVLDREILGYAEQRVSVRGLKRVQRTHGRRPPDRLCPRHCLPRRAGEPRGEWNPAPGGTDAGPG